jgi:arylsulfatase A-like enzyme
MKKNPYPRIRKHCCILTGVLLLAIVSLQVHAQRKKDLPNIVYILADDLGYGDVSVNNPQGKISTLNIDRLAGQGMRFTDAHTTSSVCTPSRYSVLTGRYPWRSRLPVGVLRGYSRTLIDANTPTVAAMLKESAYHTAVVGKWHLGVDWVLKDAFTDSLSPKYNADNLYGITKEMNPDQIDFTKKTTGGPHTQGFDYSFILPASLDMPPYVYLENGKLTEQPTGYTKGNKLASGYTGPFWREGLIGASFDFHDVLPLFTRKANDFIRAQSPAKPFFLYFPMPAPHTPWMPTAKFTGTSKAGEYGDYVQEVDDAVGQVLHVLDSMGMSGNTMVVFASDNGPYWRDNFVQEFGHNAAGPFRGMKGDAQEGGHRVPFIVRYPGKVKAGTTSGVTTTLANLLATCADITGNTSAAYRPEDSYSILPVLTGKASGIASQPAIVNISSKGVYDIRKGPWKLIVGLGSGGMTVPSEIKPEKGKPVGQLYNLDTDIHEDHNLYDQYPDKVKELKELLQKIQQAKKRPTT